jgi:hypothetical protein
MAVYEGFASEEEMPKRKPAVGLRLHHNFQLTMAKPRWKLAPAVIA